jgi:hypothetical protein
MNDNDLDNHPCQVSYDAGVKFAKKFPNLDDFWVKKESRNHDDEENFLTGYYNTVNK